ncbi:NHLP leader peptide family RiPP precursor [Actinopolymorpha rutila]|uniref:NHLP leader peptide domain-containing protein n=1 Tax=Actinopolymorpha rutila TaxID=446787 RepID=A0A852ZCT6_9ACTN|nr:NHLP leader peptide family RiPP precursor [Actinopolymorpha rutila]NYH89995.1 hypothetical protein [Actinopolymorpha rutila]
MSKDEKQKAPEGDFNELWAQLVARAWDDEALMKRLKSDPRSVMEENGLPVPHGLKVKVVQNSEDTIYLPLAKKPTLAELSEDDLSQVSAAARPIGGYCGNDTCSVTYFPLRAETTPDQ